MFFRWDGPGPYDIISCVETNESAPDFELPDLNGDPHRLSSQRGRIVVINFWSCECPHSERTDRAMMATLSQLSRDVVLWPVAANRIESPEAITVAAAARRLPLVLIDADHRVADLYGALTTPHAFVVDREGILRYQGAVDDATFRLRMPTRFFLEEAVEALMDGRLPAVGQTPAYGCAIVREAVE